MGDESAMSGMSSLEPSAAGGAAPGAPGGAPSAEGIIKKMSTYWFIIGALPLIMFLLVAVPTVIYVKSVAGYVNAFYCSSKACDAFAELIKSTKGGKEACADFYGHVCDKVSASVKKTGYTGTRIFKVVTDPKYKPEIPGAVLPDAMSVRGMWAQCHSLSSGEDAVGFAKTLLMLPKWPFLKVGGGFDPGLSLEDAVAVAHKEFGVDVLFSTRLVYNPWAKMEITYQYPQPDTVEVEIGAPMTMEYDPLALMLKEFKVDLTNLLRKFLGTTAAFSTSSNANALTCSDHCVRVHTALTTLRQTVLDDAMMMAPEVFTMADLDKLSPQAPKPPVIQLRYAEILKKILPSTVKLDRVIVSQPKYLAELVKAINAVPGPAQMKTACTVTYVGFMLLIYVFGPFLARVYDKNLGPPVFEPLCRLHTDYMLSTLVSMTMVSSYNKRWVYGNLVDGKKVKANEAILRMTLDVRDSILKAFALSTSSNDKSRINAYVKLKTMTVVPTFYNATSSPDPATVDKILANLGTGALGKDDFSADHLVQIRKNIMAAYWEVLRTKDSTKLLIREQLMATNLIGVYSYGGNIFYPSGGTFSPEHFKDSPVFMMNHARIGYYMSRGMLKAFDMRGGNVYPGIHLPADWRGTLTAMKFNGVMTCLKKAVGTKPEAKGMIYDIAMDTMAVTPGFRHFRAKALQKAAPKPEYRLAKFPEASSTELYFYAIATPMCEGLKQDKRLNFLVKYDRYFQEGFKCQSGALKTGPDILYGKGADPGCYFWNTTRVDY